MRNDLQTIRAELNVRCPTLAVFCLRESYAGFDEFAARIPHNVRVGSAASRSRRPAVRSRAALKGLGWLVQWFSMWSLKLMTDEYHHTQGTANLVTMKPQLWRDLPALCHLIEVSFSTHARAEPILVRGCYFVACGPDPEGHAFAAGLINGKASKIIADPTLHFLVPRCRRDRPPLSPGGPGTGPGTAAIALPIWFYAIMPRLGNSGSGWAGWAGPRWASWAWSGSPGCSLCGRERRCAKPQPSA